MKLETLRLRISDGRIEFLIGDKRSFRSKEAAAARELAKVLDENEYEVADARADLIRPYTDKLVPAEFLTWFRDWSCRPDDDSALCIYTADRSLSSLPWTELLTPPDGPPDRSWIVRVCDPKAGTAPDPMTSPVEILLAGWSKLTRFPMPGIERELQFPQRFSADRFQVRVLADPNRADLLSACEASKAAVVHLSPPAFTREKEDLAIPITGEDEKRDDGAVKFELLRLTALFKSLKHNKQLRLAVVNACNAGLVGCESICRALGVAALGWPSLVADETAADFTFYFYERMLEGLTPVAAVRSFARAMWSRRTRLEFPVLWFPNPTWASWAPIARKMDRQKRPTRLSRKSRSSDQATAYAETTLKEDPGQSVPGVRQPGVRMEFSPRPWISPALLINGIHPIAHINIDSSEERTVHLCITCDTGGGLSTYRQTVPLKKGTNPVAAEEIHFPALHELIDRHAHRRRVSFTATILDWNNNEIYGATRAAVWMGAKEWLDQEDTWAFVPAFVNPFDQGVLKVFEAATKVLRTLGQPTDAFNGYSTDPSWANKQMRAIYQTIRDDANGITYISPPGSPLFDGSAKRSVGQVIRTHDEVINHRLGTCHDLALLLAACAEYVGIRPVIALLAGHTVVGYWTAKNHQEEYWRTRLSGLRTGKFGEDWTISNIAQFVALVTDKRIQLIEATHLCKKETFDAACDAGAESSRRKDQIEVAVDIYASRRSIQPL